MPAKFGTSGLRGLIEEVRGDATTRHVLAFAESLLDQKRAGESEDVFIGWDLRQSSPDIAGEVVSALVKAKLIPRVLGAIPTPALAFYAMSKGSAAIMVTGSHIPADRNGIKFYLPSGEISKADEERIADRSAVLEAQSFPASAVHTDTRDHTSALEAFRARCASIVPEGCLKGKVIGVYEHSTVGRTLIHQILKDAGAKTMALGRADTFVALDTEDVSRAVQDQLKTWCARHQLDAIVSADGDADRPLMTDESGRLVRGDAIGILTCQHLGSKKVATPVTSSSAVEAVLQAKITRTRVGSPHVIAAMLNAQTQGAQDISGFEANGGFLVGTPHVVEKRTLAPLPTRDAYLPILAVLYRAASKNLPLSALVASLNLPASMATRIENYATEKSLALLQMLQSNQAARAEFTSTFGNVITVDSLDGYRMHMADGKTVHLRPSGNAPELRIYVEARSHIEAQRLLQATRAKILSL
jgi:phosphomannomutase